MTFVPLKIERDLSQISTYFSWKCFSVRVRELWNWFKTQGAVWGQALLLVVGTRTWQALLFPGTSLVCRERPEPYFAALMRRERQHLETICSKLCKGYVCTLGSGADLCQGPGSLRLDGILWQSLSAMCRKSVSLGSSSLFQGETEDFSHCYSLGARWTLMTYSLLAWGLPQSLKSFPEWAGEFRQTEWPVGTAGHGWSFPDQLKASPCAASIVLNTG